MDKVPLIFNIPMSQNCQEIRDQYIFRNNRRSTTYVFFINVCLFVQPKASGWVLVAWHKCSQGKNKHSLHISSQLFEVSGYIFLALFGA